MRIPSIKTIRKELVSIKRNLRQSFRREDLVETNGSHDFAGTDVRLQVTKSGWSIHTGDSSYDMSHSGYWGVSCISWDRENLEATAKSLVDQVKTDRRWNKIA